MYLYRAYGLTISSDSALPELIPADFDAAAVTIRRGRIDRAFSQATPVVFDIGPRVAYLAWREVGAFLVEDGKTILADLRRGVPDDLARLPLLGAVLAALLHQRGLLVLHGSAVAVAGRAAILIGDKGAGKSTMAAALFARGHRLIADDVVAVHCASSGGLQLAPGYPQLKLSEAAATVVLGDQADLLPTIHQWSEKRCRRVGEGSFASHPVPPGRVYALVKGEGCRDIAVAPQEAVTTLLQHCYMARFGNQVLHGAAACINLRQCAALDNYAPVHRLEVPATLQHLDRAARLIEADLARASATASAHPEPVVPSPSEASRRRVGT